MLIYSKNKIPFSHHSSLRSQILFPDTHDAYYDPYWTTIILIVRLVQPLSLTGKIDILEQKADIPAYLPLKNHRTWSYWDLQSTTLVQVYLSYRYQWFLILLFFQHLQKLILKSILRKVGFQQDSNKDNTSSSTTKA